jgi:hypothetical protein
MPSPLSHCPGFVDTGRPKQEVLPPIGAGDYAIGTTLAVNSTVRVARFFTYRRAVLHIPYVLDGCRRENLWSFDD